MEEMLENTDRDVFHHTMGQDSFEFGKSGSRIIIKSICPNELNDKIKEMRELGYIDEEGNACIPVVKNDEVKYKETSDEAEVKETSKDKE